MPCGKIRKLLGSFLAVRHEGRPALYDSCHRYCAIVLGSRIGYGPPGWGCGRSRKAQDLAF